MGEECEMYDEHIFQWVFN